MKLKDLYEKSTKKGTYAGVRFDEPTKLKLQKYVEDNEIPNSTSPEKYHTTVLYSRKHLPNYKAPGVIQPPMTGNPSGLSAWDTQGENGPKTKCLIFQYDSPELSARHSSLMKEHEATFDYPEYKPHVTLSYDIGDMDISSLPDIKGIGPLNIVEEYGEDLDLDWARNKGVKKGGG
ncbi:hypothetical protein E4H12_13870 [Candidatus Thorarchaeota archaeon]|nr:MAG: hypothetical protein E4H12_13870 [Candidatus Thorarchaeota archaeon]